MASASRPSSSSGKDSPEQKFLDAKVKLIAKQILVLAKKSKQQDTAGHPIGEAQVALALIQQLKELLDESQIVSVESEVNGKVSHNRINGVLAQSA